MKKDGACSTERLLRARQHFISSYKKSMWHIGYVINASNERIHHYKRRLASDGKPD